MPGVQRIVIYHNPRCTKSRQTLELLRSRGFEPVVLEYLETPPDPAEMRTLLDQLCLKPRQLLRVQEPAYKSAGLDRPDVSDDRIISAMIEHPILIERPIVVANGRATLGRPPENVLSLLDSSI